jgi:hypothetical protein
MKMTDKIIRREGDDSCSVRQIDPENRTIRFLAQSTKMASDNLIILAHAGKKQAKRFMRNPIVVPYHVLWPLDDVTPVVVGNVVKDEFEADGRYQTVKFATSELAEQWWHLYAVDKVMRMVSIAWYYKGEVREENPDKMVKLLQKNGITLTDSEMNQLRGIVKEYVQRDLSLVPIGADPDAMQQSADGGNGVAQHMMRGYEKHGGVWTPEGTATRTTATGIEVEETEGVDAPQESDAAIGLLGDQHMYDSPTDGDEAPEDSEARTEPTLAEQVAELLIPQMRDMVEPLADQVTDLYDRLLGETPPASGNDNDTTQDEEAAGEHDEAGQPGDAGEANADTDGEPDVSVMHSPYADLLDMSRGPAGHGPKATALPNDLIRLSQTLVDGINDKIDDKPKED